MRSAYLWTLAVCACALALALPGIGRSLWLDEAWVANSILSPTLAGMFRYPDSLQTSPPLFLLLSRLVAGMGWVSEAVFRVVPLGFAMLAAAGMLAVSRRLLSWPWAMLATALVLFHPVSVEYSHTAKHYSGELAATTLVLLACVRYAQRPEQREYWILLIAVLVGLMFAYPVAFLIFGTLFITRGRRAVGLAAASAGVLILLGILFVLPNTSADLRAFWRSGDEKLFTVGLMASLVVALLLCFRGRISFLLGLPCLLLAAACLSGWYPVSQRTRLWVLPCFVLLVLSNVEGLIPSRIRIVVGVIGLLVVVGVGLREQIMHRNDPPQEDFAGAFRYLKEHVGAQDLLLVHAAAREEFRFYTSAEGWSLPAPRWGHTGEPCCGRSERQASSQQAVREDLARLLPTGYSGRVWLLYPSRPSHWKYVGLDEGNLWRSVVWEKGCPPEPYVAFHNIAVSPMMCVSSH